MSAKHNRLIHPVKARKAEKARQRKQLAVGVALDLTILGTTTYSVVKGVQGIKNKRARRASDGLVLDTDVHRISDASLALEEARYEFHMRRIGLGKLRAYRVVSRAKTHLKAEYRVLDAKVVRGGTNELRASSIESYIESQHKQSERREGRKAKKAARASAKAGVQAQGDDSTLSVVPESQVS